LGRRKKIRYVSEKQAEGNRGENRLVNQVFRIFRQSSVEVEQFLSPQIVAEQLFWLDIHPFKMTVI